MTLFTVVLLSHVTMVAALASCHSDRDKDDRSRENCTAAGLRDIPRGLIPSTKVLLFPNNLFSSLTWSSFQVFAEIYEIDLTGNQVPLVTPSAAPVLPTLAVLRLGSNLLTSLPDGCFSACPALTELYLNDNTIQTLSNHTFSGLSSLEILELSSNRIQVLPVLLLHPLPAIKSLYLENNKIKVMPDGWFSQKEDVPYLFLSANPWVCSCPLRYLYDYVEENEFNIYTRSGPTVTVNPFSVVCGSPSWFYNRSMISLTESELCSTSTQSPAQHGTGTYAPPAVLATDHAASTPTHQYSKTTWHWSQTLSQTAVSGAGSLSRGEVGDRPATSGPPPAFGSIRPTTKRSTTTIVVSERVPTTTEVPSTPTPKIPLLIVASTEEEERGLAAKLHGGAGLFCVWMFAGCFLLCLLSVAIILLTSSRFFFWYRTTYKPLNVALKRKGARGEGVRLLVYDQKGEEGGSGAGPGGALYRSVLFIHRDDEENTNVYRKTMHHLLSKEEEIEGWRDVMEECRVSAREEGEGGCRAEIKGYSVILRQESEGGAQELEWVLGGWEATPGSGPRGGLDLRWDRNLS